MTSIEFWNCRQCNYPMSDVLQRGQRKAICNHCSYENRALRERMGRLRRKVMKVLYP